MSEKEIRQKAMLRYDQGEKAKEIYTSYGKSERWFFKWLKRYKTGDPNWAEEQSRRPYQSPNKIDPKMEQAVIATREGHRFDWASCLATPAGFFMSTQLTERE